MEDREPDGELVVNPSTRIVHRASCYRVTLFVLGDPMPLERWPVDDLDRLRGCGTCEPDGFRLPQARRSQAYTSRRARAD